MAVSMGIFPVSWLKKGAHCMQAITSPAAAPSKLEPTPEEPVDENKAADKGKQPKHE